MISCCFLIILGLFPDIALAQELSSSGVMNDVLNRFHSAASTWAPTIEGAASRLFWTLVTISMVWTFGMMALRKADIGEFFAELVRFTIFTGFYWWLLSNATHGMNIAGSIVDSLQQLGAEAGGLGSSKLGPSSILDMGFELYDRTVEATSELSWKEFATALMMELMALAVLVVLAIISVNLLLLLAASWILLYAGVFFLGFGGSRWTSDMAINYYKSILGIASQLLSMVLIVAIGKQFLLDYHNKISENMASQELAVMLVISLCLLFLVNKVPPMISSLVSGGNIGTMGIGSFGAGAAMGTVMTAASMGAAGMKIAGGAIASGAANATSGISAIKAAFEQAQSSMADGTMPSGGSETTQNRSGGSNTDSGDSPFSKAAGFDGTDRSSVSTQNRTKDADSSIRDDMAEFSDNALSGGDKHSMNQSTTDNDEVSDFVNRNKSDK
ncbi:P-type conjugative transfer protein TrbL [Providencia rettgeri]|uniref:P-type conjugative transfer protein TrbL n=1 Tax=Providencia rettgeri TaxID=587 RepID=UPI001B37A646|nr:P-type conjugative transfer protein TrbL [Providencia rettgeri]MBQ0342011.1 P-type conjugative transfer protein TrbL [Providencia rettgeri]